MSENTNPLERLLEIMTRLRDPESGCPWDIEQTFATIAPYTIEEAYEVADAIERDDIADLQEELGDLLFQVVFHAEMARQAGFFEFKDVAETVSEKMVRRHPHVFGDSAVRDAASQTVAWETHKANERKVKNSGAPQGRLDGVPLALPALTRAEKLGKRAARAGFDWPEIGPVQAKIEEELSELKAEIENQAPAERIAEEMGDLLFACVNLARHLNVDAETALRASNDKFVRRFNYIESELDKISKSPESTSLEEMEELWLQAKNNNGGGGKP